MRRPPIRPGAKDSGRVRIIAGTFRSRILHFPDAPGLRPTPDRVRETLFNWLREHVVGARCLDLFAGSGALGFEAASRGAKQVVMVENNLAVATSLRVEAEKLPAPQIEILQTDALSFLRSCASQFDLVFLDPPYDSGLLEPCLVLLDRIVHPGSLIYLESRAPAGPLPQRLAPHRSGQAGQIAFHLAEYRPG